MCCPAGIENRKRKKKASLFFLLLYVVKEFLSPLDNSGRHLKKKIERKKTGGDSLAFFFDEKCPGAFLRVLPNPLEIKEKEFPDFHHENTDEKTGRHILMIFRIPKVMGRISIKVGILY